MQASLDQRRGEMRRVIGLWGYWVIGLGIVFLASYVFAQEEDIQAIRLRAMIVRIPQTRILDWQGQTPKVNANAAWQDQALSEGDVVLCPAGQPEDAFVRIALNPRGDVTMDLSSGQECTVVNGDCVIEGGGGPFEP